MLSLTLIVSEILRSKFELSSGGHWNTHHALSIFHLWARSRQTTIIDQSRGFSLMMKPFARRKGPPPPLDLRDSKRENVEQFDRLTPTFRTPTPVRATATPIQIIPTQTPTRTPTFTTSTTSKSSTILTIPTVSTSPTRATTVTISRYVVLEIVDRVHFADEEMSTVGHSQDRPAQL